jgi:mRNA degradation ribonuclease J1/J2
MKGYTMQKLYRRLSVVSVFEGVLNTPLLRAFFSYAEGETVEEKLNAYGAFVAEIYRGGGSLVSLVSRLVFEDENVRVEYIPTKHIPNSYAILITSGEKRVLFGGDFSHWLAKDDVPAVIQEEIDLFVCEMAHFTAEQISPYLAKCRAKTVAFTHVYPIDKYNDIEGMKGKYPFKIITPRDGDKIEI